MPDEPTDETMRHVLGDAVVDEVQRLSPDGRWEQTRFERPDGTVEVQMTRRAPGQSWEARWTLSTEGWPEEGEVTGGTAMWKPAHPSDPDAWDFTPTGVCAACGIQLDADDDIVVSPTTDKHLHYACFRAATVGYDPLPEDPA